MVGGTTLHATTTQPAARKAYSTATIASRRVPPTSTAPAPAVRDPHPSRRHVGGGQEVRQRLAIRLRLEQPVCLRSVSSPLVCPPSPGPIPRLQGARGPDGRGDTVRGPPRRGARGPALPGP